MEGDILLGVFGLIFWFGFYFLPTIIALLKHKRNALAIGVTNFLFGWTIIGWFIALIWALTTDSPVQNININNNNNNNNN